MFSRIPKSAPLTPEDRDVVADLVLHRRGICWMAVLMTTSYKADAADALVMYHRAKFSRQCADVQASRMRPALYWSIYPWRR